MDRKRKMRRKALLITLATHFFIIGVFLVKFIRLNYVPEEYLWVYDISVVVYFAGMSISIFYYIIGMGYEE